MPVFPTTIAGSLPKPAWLAEPNKLWAPWRARRRRARRRPSATPRCSRSSCRRIAASTSSPTASSRASISCTAFSSSSTASISPRKVEIGHPRRPLQGDGADGDRRAAAQGPRARARGAARARHTARKLKFTLPGPMTIVDTIADAPLRRPREDGDGVRRACSTPRRARSQADGVDVIQFDEPAFNVYMREVEDWGIEALHRAIEGLTCTTAVHICYGYGIKANIDWKATLGSEWRQYEEIFPALASSRIDQVSVECRNSRVPIEPVEAARRQGRAGRRHRRRERRDRDARARSRP